MDPDPRTMSEAQRSYFLVRYEHYEEKPQGVILTLKSGRRVGFLHTEIYGHHPELKSLGVAKWSAENRGLRI